MSAAPHSSAMAPAQREALLDQAAHDAMLIAELARLVPDVPQDCPDQLAALAAAMELMANRAGWLVDMARNGSGSAFVWLVPERCRPIAEG